jgi:hypothetical protein
MFPAGRIINIRKKMIFPVSRDHYVPCEQREIITELGSLLLGSMASKALTLLQICSKRYWKIGSILKHFKSPIRLSISNHTVKVLFRQY